MGVSKWGRKQLFFLRNCFFWILNFVTNQIFLFSLYSTTKFLIQVHAQSNPVLTIVFIFLTYISCVYSWLHFVLQIIFSFRLHFLLYFNYFKFTFGNCIKFFMAWLATKHKHTYNNSYFFFMKFIIILGNKYYRL